ncbi:MAG: hypothetical protein ACLUSP_00305 [Christensenellales bacterium]
MPGDVAGIKSVSFTVSGTNAYGYLKAEKEFIVSSAFRRSTRKAAVTHRSQASKLCPKSSRIILSKSVPKILKSTRTVRAARAVST